jgi:hypothetical protein
MSRTAIGRPTSAAVLAVVRFNSSYAAYSITMAYLQAYLNRTAHLLCIRQQWMAGDPSCPELSCGLPGAPIMPPQQSTCFVYAVAHPCCLQQDLLQQTAPVQTWCSSPPCPCLCACHLEHHLNQQAQFYHHLQGPVVHVATSLGAPAMLHTCLPTDAKPFLVPRHEQAPFWPFSRSCYCCCCQCRCRRIHMGSTWAISSAHAIRTLLLLVLLPQHL